MPARGEAGLGCAQGGRGAGKEVHARHVRLQNRSSGSGFGSDDSPGSALWEWSPGSKMRHRRDQTSRVRADVLYSAVLLLLLNGAAAAYAAVLLLLLLLMQMLLLLLLKLLCH